MALILDLDLDFFVWPIARGSVDGRLSEDEYKCASPDQVTFFLEQQCGLSKAQKLPGRSCKEHDEAFDAWKEWIQRGLLGQPFGLAHADAHAQLSYRDASWRYLLTGLPALAASERTAARNGVRRLNA